MLLLRLIVIAIIIYLVFKWIVTPLLRILLPYLVRKVVEKQFGQQNPQSKGPKREDGSIHVDYIPKKEPGKPGKDKGDYIDYEEIK